MTNTNETRRAGDADRALECSLLGGVNAQGNSPSNNFLQTPLPTFFELVAENALGHLRAVHALCEACASFIDAADPEAFADARRRLIEAARRFADVSRPIVEPAILSRERADSLERQAADLDNLALLLRGEAAESRAIIGMAR